MDHIRVSGISRLDGLVLKKQFPDATITFEGPDIQDSQHGELMTTAALIGLSVIGLRLLATWLLKTNKSNRIEKTIEIVKADGTKRSEHIIIDGAESKSEASVIRALAKLTKINVSDLALRQ